MTFSDVPGAFEKYGDQEGVRGMAKIIFSCSHSSRTAISGLWTKSPLLVQRALYPDTKLTEMAHVYLMSSAGGVLQGDRIDIEIDAEDNTLARITTQSATKIYKMDKGYAIQKVNIRAGEGSYVEFVPRQLIPFKSSRFFQDVTIKAATGSTVLYAETVSTGRTASGEHFDFDICFLRIRALDPENHLLFSDVSCIEPSIDRKETFDRLFGGKSIWSTIYVLAPDSNLAGMGKEITEAALGGPVLAGCSLLPNDCGLFVRMLDNSIDRIEEMISLVTAIVRNNSKAVSRKSKKASRC